MYQTIAEFVDVWRSESENTHKIMCELTDASLAQRVSPEGRTLGRIAWHIVQTLGEMGGRAGLAVEGADEKTPQPATAAAIADAYRAGASALERALPAAWSDADLAGEIELYGEKWTRAKTLHVLLVHEIHHRAQMTVLMRQAGLRVPGVYGPAREEWTAYGMPAQE
ncbi:MAG TPA: DinB family protein [Vicinamibacterales bacterium]|nr:DinB family protein [Vicinamibacterales bacterium]HPW20019.1 DinB family protein [Vicinamibacterales bacterium]